MKVFYPPPSKKKKKINKKKTPKQTQETNFCKHPSEVSFPKTPPDA